MKGRHGEYQTIWQAIDFAAQYGKESISIGGGEPTLHPRFFDILKHSLDVFDYVWMATNGSQTETMLRLAAILNQEDEIYLMDNGNYCDCSEEDIENGECYCYEKMADDIIWQSEKLEVALSLDPYHDSISQKIVDLWTRYANQHRRSGFEIRNVTNSHSGVIAQGRAKRTQVGWNENDCICPDIIIKPDGKLKACGCTGAPVVGDIWQGIDHKWEKILFEDDTFGEANCYKYWKRNH